MKKLFISFLIFSTFAIIFSVPSFYSCDNSSLCSQEQQAGSFQCLNCSFHIEVAYSAKAISSSLVLPPIFLGEISFEDINIQEQSVTFRIERPPTRFS